MSASICLPGVDEKGTFYLCLLLEKDTKKQTEKLLSQMSVWIKWAYVISFWE